MKKKPLKNCENGIRKTTNQGYINGSVVSVIPADKPEYDNEKNYWVVIINHRERLYKFKLYNPEIKNDLLETIDNDKESGSQTDILFTYLLFSIEAMSFGVKKRFEFKVIKKIEIR